MFVTMYLIGLVIGFLVYALTYFFTKSTSNFKRVLAVFLISILMIIWSITVIGGFEGMPFGVVGAGAMTTALLLAFFGKSTLWKKVVFTGILLLVLSVAAYEKYNEVDYMVGEKTNEDHDVDSYIQHLQDDPSIKGYKVFTMSEGRPGVVVSLGGKMAGDNIEILRVKEEGDTTKMLIKTFYNKSEERNPVIIIGLKRVQKNIVIMDTDGTTFGKVDES
ncbi:YesK family protein [Peribacillus kribbensis]|uniref:YesK family protein n=1 Tax=Peribacillus kribbensis TaxID=356658 RepID=UPI00041DFCB5|nr:YesK family protein [Peribacillus kribbensis]